MYQDPPNPYYDPEKMGLEIVEQVDASGSYEFDMVVVFKDKEGNHYMDTDSGCSCPCPFEGHDIPSMTKLTLHNLEELENSLKNVGYGEYNLDLAERTKFLDKVKASMKA